MSMVMMRVPKDKTMELKGMISEGLHIFGRAMSLAEEMCEGDMGERGGYGQRDMDYAYGDRMGMREDYMGMRHYPQYPMEYGERQGVRGTGRYSRF